jgi:hypothetical protein
MTTETFKKRQKEAARRQKQQEKAARRAERKLEKRKVETVRETRDSDLTEGDHRAPTIL